jgi:hypothetical protein
MSSVVAPMLLACHAETVQSPWRRATASVEGVQLSAAGTGSPQHLRLPDQNLPAQNWRVVATAQPVPPKPNLVSWGSIG